jgi:hypothetical protein
VVKPPATMNTTQPPASSAAAAGGGPSEGVLPVPSPRAFLPRPHRRKAHARCIWVEQGAAFSFGLLSLTLAVRWCAQGSGRRRRSTPTCGTPARGRSCRCRRWAASWSTSRRATASRSQPLRSLLSCSLPYLLLPATSFVQELKPLLLRPASSAFSMRFAIISWKDWFIDRVSVLRNTSYHGAFRCKFRFSPL